VGGTQVLTHNVITDYVYNRGAYFRQRFEQGGSWESGPQMGYGYDMAWTSSTAKLNAYQVRVWLDDAVGAKVEWRPLGETLSWDEEFDTSGVSGGTANALHLGWSTFAGAVFIDDIMVEDDYHIAPVTETGPLFYENYNDGVMNTAMWINWSEPDDFMPPQSSVSQYGLTNLGGGDYAFFLQGPGGWHWWQWTYSTVEFPRGHNLRVRYRVWYDPAMGEYQFDEPPNGLAIQGGFGSSNTTQTWTFTEALVGREWHDTLDTMRLEQDHSWSTNGGASTTGSDPPASPPVFSTDFQDAFENADSKATSLLIQIWLDDTIGAMAEWSDDDGATWTVETDTREKTLGAGNGWGSERSDVYIGFSTHYGAPHMDDIYVMNDLNNDEPEPVPPPPINTRARVWEVYE